MTKVNKLVLAQSVAANEFLAFCDPRYRGAAWTVDYMSNHLSWYGAHQAKMNGLSDTQAAEVGKLAVDFFERFLREPMKQLIDLQEKSQSIRP